MDKVLDDLANMRAIGSLPDGRPLANGHRNGISPVSPREELQSFPKSRQAYSPAGQQPPSPNGQRGNMGAMAPRPIAMARPQVRTVGRTSKTITRKTSTTGEKVLYGGVIYAVQSMWSVPKWYRAWKEYFYPHDAKPDIVKTYDVRSSLPVRIFFPKNYEKTSSQPLPTLFTIHGGGFCLSTARDDDEWNRGFADRHETLVVALEYAKAPQAPFPAGLNDLEALYEAVLADESLPIARAATGKSRIALLGFSSGANMAMALAQMPGVKQSPDAPRAVVSMYGMLDLSRSAFDKLRNRFYKPALGPPRGDRVDYLARIAPVFDWAYVPYGQDVTDPLVSPAFARLEDLPRHVYVVGAELDMFAHESWRLAVRLANDGAMARGLPAEREEPDPASKLDKIKCVGKRASSKEKGELELADERYAWEATWDGGAASVNWLLVPDVIHGFDNALLRASAGGEEAVRDAEMKMLATQERLADWLRGVVYK